MQSQTDFDAWRAAVVEAVPRCVVKFPRGSGAGPSGSRFERWGSLRDHDEGMKAAGEVLARLLVGEVSEGMLQAHLSGRIIALKKKGGGIRPVSCGSVLRRIAGRATCQVSKQVLKEAWGPLQYGVGRTAGVETVHKTLAVLAAARPDAAFLSLDATNAFNAVSRNAIRAGISANAPVLARTAAAWYGRPVLHHWWDQSGRHYTLKAERGVTRAVR